MRGGMARARGEAAAHSSESDMFSEPLLCAANRDRDPARRRSLTCLHRDCAGNCDDLEG